MVIVYIDVLYIELQVDNISWLWGHYNEYR